jgi:hypothetical protein
MAMGDLDIGGLFTPDGILSAAERVAAAQRQISREVFDAEPDVPDDFFAAWSRFTADFLAWKGANSGWFSSVWNTTRDELTEFVGQYTALRAQWAALHPGTRAESFTIKHDSIGGALEDAGKAAGMALKSVAIGLACLVGVGLAAYLAVKYAPAVKP